MKEYTSRKRESSLPSTKHTPDPFQPRPFAPTPEVQTLETQPPAPTGLISGSSFRTFSIQDPSGTSRQPIQPKLTIGAPGDKYEQEADRVASQVVQHIHTPHSNAPLQRDSLAEDELQRSPMLQRLEMPEEDELQRSPLLQRNALEENELQMRPATKAVSEGPVSASLESAISQARGSGQSLDPSLQRQMGQAMGANFSGVTIHTDSQSDQLNRSIQAKAFTTGQDIFFRQGAYQPESRSGQELIAHELTHVVQQNHNPSLQRAIQCKKDDPKNAKYSKLQYEQGEIFEKNLGLYLFNHPKAINSVDNALTNMKEVMGVNGDPSKASKIFGGDQSIYAGNVGKQVEVVIEAVNHGNLRERLTAFYNAALGPFKQMVTEAMQQKNWRSLSKAGINQEGINAIKDRNKKINSWRVKLPGLYDRNAKDLYTAPGNPLERKSNDPLLKTNLTRQSRKGRIENPKAKDEYGKDAPNTSQRNQSDLKNDLWSAELSERETNFYNQSKYYKMIDKRLIDKYGGWDKFVEQNKQDMDLDWQAEKLPWEEGGTRFKPNVNNSWIKEAKDKLKLPVVSGPSGTTDRMLSALKYLGNPADPLDFRLALLGWMLTSHDHSFHEVMAVSKTFGLPYDAGLDAYKRIAPLQESDVRKNACLDQTYPGLFPDEIAYHTKLDSGDSALYAPHKSNLNYYTQHNPLLEEQTGMNRTQYNQSGLRHLLKNVTAYTSLAYHIQNIVASSGSKKAKIQINLLLKKARSQPDLLEALRYKRNVDNKKWNDLDPKTRERYQGELGKMGSLSMGDQNMAFVVACNPNITADELIEESKEHNRQTQNSMKKLPTFQGKAYRGEAGISNPYKPGKIITVNKFLSASRNTEYADHYATQARGITREKDPESEGSVAKQKWYTHFLKGVVLEIDSKTARDVNSVSINEGEGVRDSTEQAKLDEVIFLPGTKFKVGKSKQDKTFKYPVIELQET